MVTKSSSPDDMVDAHQIRWTPGHTGPLDGLSCEPVHVFSVYPPGFIVQQHVFLLSLLLYGGILQQEIS